MANDELIYDVGAHKGEDTEFYLKKGFGVVTIEAIPEFCVLLEQRFAKFLHDGQLKMFSCEYCSMMGAIITRFKILFAPGS
jgi:hypothetical protein